jgi:HEPN domain-containing protein
MRLPRKGSALSDRGSPQELAKILLTKASHDFNMARLAVDEDPEYIGDQAFFAKLQESAEKCLKAVLCLRIGDYPKTHDLASLFNLMAREGLPVPEHFDCLKDLTPYSGRERYESSLSRGCNDRHFMLNMVLEFRAWIESLLGGTR